jgi:hypothetical protein
MAQPDYYLTTDGSMMIEAVFLDSAITAKSKKVTVLIDYNSGEFQLFFDASTLKTGILALDTLLAKEKNHVIHYEGRFGLDHVQTESHPPLDFTVEGTINCSDHESPVRGIGRLEHLGNVYSCYLNMTFDLKLDQLPFDIAVEGLDENIRIVIVQMLLYQRSGSPY